MWTLKTNGTCVKIQEPTILWIAKRVYDCGTTKGNKMCKCENGSSILSNNIWYPCANGLKRGVVNDDGVDGDWYWW